MLTALRTTPRDDYQRATAARLCALVMLGWFASTLAVSWLGSSTPAHIVVTNVGWYAAGVAAFAAVLPRVGLPILLALSAVMLVAASLFFELLFLPLLIASIVIWLYWRRRTSD